MSDNTAPASAVPGDVGEPLPDINLEPKKDKVLDSGSQTTTIQNNEESVSRDVEPQKRGSVILKAIKWLMIAVLTLGIMFFGALFFFGDDIPDTSDVLEGLSDPMLALSEGVQGFNENTIQKTVNNSTNSPEGESNTLASGTSDVFYSEQESVTNDSFDRQQQVADNNSTPTDASSDYSLNTSNSQYTDILGDTSNDNTQLNSLNFITRKEHVAFREELAEQFEQVNQLANNAHNSMEELVGKYVEKYLLHNPGSSNKGSSLNSKELADLRRGIIEGRVAKKLAEKAFNKVSDIENSLDERFSKLTAQISNLGPDKTSDTESVSSNVVSVKKIFPPFDFLMNEKFAGEIYSTFEVHEDRSMLVVGESETRLGWRLVKSSINQAGHLAVVEHIESGYRHTFKTGY